jgi:hypothetical protein
VVIGNAYTSYTIENVRDSQDSLIDLLARRGRIGYFFKRLEQCIEVQPTAAMTDVIEKTMIKVLSILGIVTKEVRQGPIGSFKVTIIVPLLSTLYTQ